jgi:hypothetical protein
MLATSCCLYTRSQPTPVCMLAAAVNKAPRIISQIYQEKGPPVALPPRHVGYLGPAGLPTPKLNVPSEFKPTWEGRGWLVTHAWIFPDHALGRSTLHLSDHALGRSTLHLPDHALGRSTLHLPDHALGRSTLHLPDHAYPR